MNSTTPKDISQNVRRLAQLIGSSREPVYVDVRPETGCQPNECFPNIKRKIERDGGSIQFGWTVWEWPEKLIEGEFHAVWVNAAGEYLDITPKVDGETRILFIPDDHRIYNNEPIDNIRLALCDDPIVKETIRRGEEMTKLRKQHNVNGRGFIPISKVLKTIIGEQSTIPSTGKIGRNDICPCGSGKKYKKCCGK